MPRDPDVPIPLSDGNLDDADLRGCRAVVYGGETDAGRAVVGALRAAGAEVGVTSTSTDGAALFALKRAAAGGPAQAVDLGNATNVRVATRKLAKALGGLDLAVVIPAPGMSEAALQDVLEIAARELARVGGGRIVLIVDAFPAAASLSIRDVPLDVVRSEATADRLAGLVLTLARREAGAEPRPGGRYTIDGGRIIHDDRARPDQPASL